MTNQEYWTVFKKYFDSKKLSFGNNDYPFYKLETRAVCNRNYLGMGLGVEHINVPGTNIAALCNASKGTLSVDFHLGDRAINGGKFFSTLIKNKEVIIKELGLEEGPYHWNDKASINRFQVKKDFPAKGLQLDFICKENKYFDWYMDNLFNFYKLFRDYGRCNV